MEEKECIKCKKVKLISEFGFRKDTGKIRNQCVLCMKEYYKNRRVLLKDEVTADNKKIYEKNKDVIKKQVKEWRDNNPNKSRALRDRENEKKRAATAERKRLKIESILSEISSGYKKCAQCGEVKGIDCFYKRKDSVTGLHSYCKQCKNKTSRIYVEKNKERLCDYNKEYNKKYQIKNRTIKTAKERNRRENSIQYRISCNLRSRLYRALKGKVKNGSAVRDLGCCISELKRHLEKNFIGGMTWENYGTGWHIDHIIPLSSFDLADPLEIKKACHYTNLQPLWAIDNLKKGSKNT